MASPPPVLLPSPATSTDYATLKRIMQWKGKHNWLVQYLRTQQDDDQDGGENSAFERRIRILGEIVGATNLTAAKRENEVHDIASSPSPSPQELEDENTTTTTTPQQAIATEQQVASKNSNNGSKNSIVNAYCEVYWGDDLIHQTKVITKNNNPIWSCDTGSLFLIDVPARSYEGNKFLKVLVIDRVSKKVQEIIGELRLEGNRVIDGEWCDEKRRSFELVKDQVGDLRNSTLNKNFLLNSSVIAESFHSLMSAGLNWFDDNTDLPEDDEMSDDDSLYGKSVTSIDDATGIDDDYVFGKTGTLALRFRTATEDDINFLKAIEIFDRGYKFAKRKGTNSLAGVKKVFDGKILASLITESNSSVTNLCSKEELKHIIDYRVHGNRIDGAGMKRFRVKPGPNPKRPLNETEYLTEAEMIAYAYAPSTNWVEAGSGSLGKVHVEIISCQGLSNKGYAKALGNKSDPFVCLIYEDCLVQTHVIRNCLSPLFMPWTQRAFVFNTMNALSSLYLGVFDHDYGPFNHKGIGRVTVDLRELKPNTAYCLKYNLYSSPVVTNRKPKGSITIRIRVNTYSDKKALLSTFNPPVLHINVKRRKTLTVARYTCYGKYREDVYHMKILRGYIDEVLEYIEQFSYEMGYAVDSLFFWRGQVSIGRAEVPLHSAIAYFSAIYVVERPHLLPSYFFFCCAWILLIILHKRSHRPSPIHRSKSIFYHLSYLFPIIPMNREGQNIKIGEGYIEEEQAKRKKMERMEANKRLRAHIAAVRREMQQFLEALSDLSLHTNEGGVNYNPLSRLLPIQLLLKDVIHIVRIVKSILSCDDSSITFILILSFTSIGLILLFLPCGLIFHWICRIFVWIFLGPWMRLAETATNRKGSTSTRHLNKVIKELKEREQKRVLEARINKEEALKLKATRILRFGRFAIRVPFTNATRYRDRPLPDSSAEPVDMTADDENDDASILSSITVTHYIPGQKHYGVMIPELSNSKTQHKRRTKLSKEQTQIKCTKKERDAQIVKTSFEHHDLSYSSSNSTELSPSKMGSEKQHSQLLAVETRASPGDTGAGFELIPIPSGNKHVESQNTPVKLKVDGEIVDHRCDQQGNVRGENEYVNEPRAGPDADVTEKFCFSDPVYD